MAGNPWQADQWCAKTGLTTVSIPSFPPSHPPWPCASCYFHGWYPLPTALPPHPTTPWMLPPDFDFPFLPPNPPPAPAPPAPPAPPARPRHGLREPCKPPTPAASIIHLTSSPSSTFLTDLLQSPYTTPMPPFIPNKIPVNTSVADVIARAGSIFTACHGKGGGGSGGKPDKPDKLKKRLEKNLEKWAVTRVREMGDGKWERGRTFVWGTEACKKTLEEYGWVGTEGEPVWLVLHRKEFG